MPSDETVPVIREGEAAPQAVVLRWITGTSSAGVFVLRKGFCRIGSAEDNDLVVRDSTVSRHHAELALTMEGVGVRDLSSRNGTYYLGQKIERVVLSPGARLGIGNAVLAIEPYLEDDALAPFHGDSYRGVVGLAPAMQRLFAMLTRLERSRVPILLQGESGVGKEVVARAIHDGSVGDKGPMVVVNCGAIPRELIGSELFGHKRGSFTGAVSDRSGAFDEADGGTLFLDEIGELPLDMQPALLRALESGEIRPIGAEKSHQVKARVVSATHRDLEADVAAGRFREDLYYRLCVVKLLVPPLRERLVDIEHLAQRFAQQAGAGDLPRPVLEALKARHYKGNVRELRNVVHAYGALGVLPLEGGVRRAPLDLALRELAERPEHYATLKDELIDQFSRLYIKGLLERTAGNQTAAARLAGMDRTHFGRLTAKHLEGRSYGRQPGDPE